MRWVKPALFLALGAVAVWHGRAIVAIAMWAIVLGWPFPPGDAVMVEHFHKHREAFEAAAMLAKDSAMDVESESAGLPDPLTGALRSAGLTGVSQSAYPPAFAGVRFWYWSYGLTDGTAKFYVYASPHPPAPLVGDLDAFYDAADSSKRWEAYRHIEGPWYLGMEHEP